MRIIGDGAGIAGGVAAEHAGRLAALDALYRLDRINQNERDRRAHPIRTQLGNELRPRHFLDALFRPPENILRPTDLDLIACRCESVRVREIEDVAKMGCHGPNQTKAFTRSGMGACQGPTVST